MFNKSLKNKMKKVQEEMEQVQYQMRSLIELFGFCGYKDGFPEITR